MLLLMLLLMLMLLNVIAIIVCNVLNAHATMTTNCLCVCLGSILPEVFPKIQKNPFTFFFKIELVSSYAIGSVINRK